MKQQAQQVAGAASGPSGSGKSAKKASGFIFLLAAGLLASCSDDTSRRESSELRVDEPAAAEPTAATPAAASAPTPAAAPPASAGRPYRVRVETAYFFDAPEQGRPSGNYLRRGDLLYGTEERGGFVQTSFRLPNGATVVGWLKSAELTRVAGSPSPTAARTRPAPRSAPPAAQDYGQEVNPAPAEPEPRPAGPAAGTAVVQVARAYFHNSPDLTQPRRAYCEQGDKVRVIDRRGEAVYVTFTNWEKVTTKGWMRQADLR
ncbi:hypothetical protein LJY25_03035 [Hymenobacter sp. BT175]|uniref:hypothetical protein n=1 Tax=Hymenobacter translucens TaxID=2886507 RepID=UPI001D0E5316|nr:hypothetical protein [Hymenobacter translucens]MCC2545406.1 hypothetical protein [Hymenobacter translucens]